MVYGTLHIRLSNGQTQSYNVGQSSILIGRGLANDLIVNDPTVAPTHARLAFQRGEVVLEDLGSINGTYINGVRLEAKKPYVLKSAELIRFGGVDALLAPASSEPPDWSAIAAAPPPPSLLTPQPEPITEVQPPPTPKLISIKLNPKRSTRNFGVSVTRSADDPDTTIQTILLAGADPTEDLTFAFRPQVIKLDPGQTKSSQLEVRGLPGNFTVTAAGKGKSYTSSTKGALVAPDRSMQVVAGIAVVLACFSGMFALAACPTTLRAVCGFVPANPVSMAVSTATFTPSATPTDTPTGTPSPTATVPPTEPQVSPTGTVAGGPSSTATAEAPTAPSYGGGVLTYKLQQANGLYSLMTLQQDGLPLVLIANKADFRVLDVSVAQNLLAVDVYDGISHTLWLIRADGAIIREAINEGWETIRNADFAPDSSFIVVDTLNAGVARYYFYASDGTRIRDTVLLTPTATSTATRSPTASRTPTATSTATHTRTATVTPSLTHTPTASKTPTGTDTPTVTRTPTNTRTPAATTTP